MPFLKALCISSLTAIFLSSSISIAQENKPTETSTKTAHQQTTPTNTKDAMRMQGHVNEIGIAQKNIQDYNQAAQSYLKTANKGDANAMFTLGYFYAKGLGVKQDYQQAMQWYLKTADKGNTEAMLNISNLYKSGKGVKQDIHQALYWYQKAKSAQHNNMPVQTLNLLPEVV